MFEARIQFLRLAEIKTERYRGEELRPIGDAEFLRERRSGVNHNLSFQESI